MVGTLVAALTVYGELRKCPIVLNSLKFYVNLVVAKLGPTVSAILCMDFLLAYGAKIDLERDHLHLRYRAMVNTSREKIADRIPVRSRNVCALLAGHK